MAKKKPEQIGAELAQLVEGDVSVDIFSRISFSTDASIYQILPACVVEPRRTDDVIAAVKYARENNIPVAARGAGSGVAGESLTSGIVINTSRYMKQITGVERDGQVVVCGPGVVLNDLNDYLARFGKKIGPDPSSGNRAVIGGIVANNATGAHSLQYGYIAGYVERVEVVLADGGIAEFTNNVDPARATDDKVARIAKDCLALLGGKEEIIAKALPQTKRNRCGYNIAGICHDGKVDLAKLLAGSEGTLGIFTKAALRTVDVPKAKALLQLAFDSFEKMAEAVSVIVETGASACELMDKTLIDMAAEALHQYNDILPRDCAASLLVEHAGTSNEEVTAKINKTASNVGQLAFRRKHIFDPAGQQRLWKARKDAAVLLDRQKGPSHPVAIIEDVSVPNNHLAEYITGLERIGDRYSITMAYYGHAGDGELHIRPYLDLSTPTGVKNLCSIAAEVFELAWSLGGTISGEHADGLLRAAFIEKQYGREFYELLKGIKKIFDPAGLMNPGKIINDDTGIMTKNLRAAGVIFAERLMTNLNFDPNEFRYEIEQCSGDGVCLASEAGTRMCPVFRAVGAELACSRAKANLLRAWITGVLKREDFESDEFKSILGLCINCKMCSVECPSGVDISKLIIEARTEYAKRKGLTRTEKTLARNRYLSALGSTFAPISNFVMRRPSFRLLLEKFTGLDMRRTMPKFQRGSFVKKGRRYLAKTGPVASPTDKVAYFVDSYANYNDHELGFAVIKCLRHNNIDVILPSQLPAPLPAIVYGDVKTARKDLAYIVRNLSEAVRAGYNIVCSEPSAALCFRSDLPLLIDSADAKLIPANTYELMSYLQDLHKQGKLRTTMSAEKRPFAYHAPCHLFALGLAGAGAELLTELAEAKITDINSGCCGLAGTFGMQKKNFDLSVDIARDMAEALNATGKKFVMTECAACKMQIEQLTGKKVIHPIKVLAKAYGLL
ncbi:MAG: anaerobic glycerol-3-phosphate dehydrogenase subunit C [Planctomycetota bacterium]|nr:MAG: anaerobic glycerol-3-phosphate dehydrogenase subunit C [Planctomycetota bacterium]